MDSAKTIQRINIIQKNLIMLGLLATIQFASAQVTTNIISLSLSLKLRRRVLVDD